MAPVRVPAVLIACLLLLSACTDDGSTATAETTTPAATGSAGATSDAGLPEVDGPFAPGRTQLPGFGEVQVRIVDGPDGEPIVLCVLLAETTEQRARGLMEVTDPDLGGYDGMVFTYDEDRTGGFYMKDTLLPLSIAYLDAEGAVVDVRDMEPCPPDTETCPTYPPSGPYRTTLEVTQGALAPLGLELGSDARLQLDGACLPAT